ncbi:MAG: nitronate monooxygenase [Bacteroidetes bacterium]|nr:nitronate monooxygenase [Bacteroidota bacterium]
MTNRITELFGIEYPIIQAGMVWCSPWELASAVSNAGGLGIIGSASMYPDVLHTHIQRCKESTDKPFAVNVALMYPDIDKLMDIIVGEEVKIVFTSAGNPATWTSFLKEKDIKVVQVVGSVKFAVKSEQAGVNAIVAEGFEAGGHNGREETTTMVLIPLVKEAVKIPVLAAGGIATGRAMLAAMALGADGVQIGTRFVASEESSGHQNFKDRIVGLGEGETKLVLKKLIPVRMIKNQFFEQVNEAEHRGASEEELKKLLGKARAKQGMFEGNLEEGELEIGEVGALIKEIKPAAQIVKEIWEEFLSARKELENL